MEALNGPGQDDVTIDEPSERDAMTWAQRFVQTVRERPGGIATDEGVMVAWFASAMDAAREALDAHYRLVPREAPVQPPKED